MLVHQLKFIDGREGLSKDRADGSNDFYGFKTIKVHVYIHCL